MSPGIGTTLKGHDYMLGAARWVGAGELWANYARKHVSACRDCGSDGFGVAYDHFLSKRTELDVAYGRVCAQASGPSRGVEGQRPETGAFHESLLLVRVVPARMCDS